MRTTRGKIGVDNDKKVKEISDWLNEVSSNLSTLFLSSFFFLSFQIFFDVFTHP